MVDFLQMGTGRVCCSSSCPAVGLCGECQEHPCWSVEGGTGTKGGAGPCLTPKGQDSPTAVLRSCCFSQFGAASRDPPCSGVQGRGGTSPAPSLLGLGPREPCLSPAQNLWDRKGSAKESRKYCTAGARISLYEGGRQREWLIVLPCAHKS